MVKTPNKGKVALRCEFITPVVYYPPLGLPHVQTNTAAEPTIRLRTLKKTEELRDLFTEGFLSGMSGSAQFQTQPDSKVALAFALWKDARVYEAPRQCALPVSQETNGMVYCMLDAYYLAVSGKSEDDANQEVVYRVGGPGDLVFELDLLAEMLPKTFRSAIEGGARRIVLLPARLLGWSRAQLLTLARTHPDMSLWFALQVAMKILDEAQYSRIARHKKERLACTELLMYWRKRWGSNANDSKTWEVPFRVNQQQMASILRCSSRALALKEGEEGEWPFTGDYGERLKVRPVPDLKSMKSDLLKSEKRKDVRALAVREKAITSHEAPEADGPGEA